MMLRAAHVLLQLTCRSHDPFGCCCPYRPADARILDLCGQSRHRQRGEDVALGRRERAPWINGYWTAAWHPRQGAAVVDDAEQDQRDDRPVREHSDVAQEGGRNLGDRVALDVQPGADGVVRERI